MKEDTNDTPIELGPGRHLTKIEGASDEAMQAINQRLAKILDSAPSDASAELVVKEIKGKYRGLLRVHSRQRKFMGGEEGKKFSEVVDSIFSQVRKQIDEWRLHRFEEKPLDV